MPGFDILDPTLNLKRDYFIEASAGTGKTFTIENAVLRLVEEGISIDQILVVTFTRAATLELKTRIRHAMEAKKLQSALLAFDEAKIFTIHGFCFNTLKENAFETGFNLSANEECSSIASYKRIFKDFLRTHVSEDEIHPKQLLILLKQNRNDPLLILKSFSKALPSNVRKFAEVAADLKQEFASLNFDFEDLIELAPLFGKMCDRKKQLKAENVEGLKRFVELFSDFQTHKLFDLPILKMVPDNLLKNKGPYPEILQKLNEKIIPLLAEISDPEQIQNRLFTLFSQFLEHVARKEDLFFYDDLLEMMQQCVHDPLFAEKVRSKYKAVLIDEFQDTDSMQWEIFSTLFFGHVPLYLVGDPKQSIYRFRGADLYTYMKAKSSMQEESKVTLTRNFRSDGNLVAALNALFGKAERLITLPKSNEVLTIPQIVAALPKSEDGKIIFCKATQERELFSFINAEIETLHQMHHIPYSSFAVLVKDHSQANRFCSQSPTPCATKKTASLLESDAFYVLEDLLQAVCNPRERFSVVKALGSSLFAIPLEELPALFESKLALFFRYQDILQCEGILGLFKTLSQELNFSENSLFQDLLQLVELIAENTQTPSECLPYLLKLKQEDPEAEILRCRAKGTEDAIQVMTMHVSKGLEFEVVFPIGLISSYDLEEEETVSETMRQLYVAMTRAKKRLYLPVTEKQNTPMHYFLSQALGDESLETFTKRLSNFLLIDCTQENRVILKQKPPCAPVEPVLPPLKFLNSFIHSYTSLATKKTLDPLQIDENQLPAGAETGVILHALFENLDFQIKKENLQKFVAFQLKKTILEPWLETVEKIVWQALQAQFQGLAGPFSLNSLEKGKMKRELEFLYPQNDSENFVKGFIDLFFEHNGYYYIIDWKSNYLESYDEPTLLKAIEDHDYSLQATIYEKAALKYLKLFDAEDKFGGIFFVFLRGLIHGEGIYKYV